MKENHLKPKSASVKRKIFISISSLFIFLFLLELTLRFIGNIYLLTRVAPNGIFSAYKKEKDTRIIMCVGDSFTFGGDLPLEFSYPFQLERILSLSNSSKEFKVVNAGICEQNSAQLLQALPRNINFYHPDTIILLVGASNWFNFIGFNKDRTFYNKLKDAFFDLRIFKMAKIIALNLEQKILIMKYKQKTSPKFYRVLYKDFCSFRSVIESNRSVFKEEAEIKLGRVDCLRQIGENEKAEELFKKLFKADPNSDIFMYQIADFLENIHGHISDDGVEKRYEQDLVAAIFRKKLENNSEIKDKLLMDYFLLFKNIQDSYKNERIELRLRQDLEEIVSLCKKNNIKLIIQNYPFPYPMADIVLKDIATKYSIPFVRNNKVFSELLSKEKKEAYFLNDSHCTPLGYQVMAENIYNVLLSANMLD